LWKDTEILNQSHHKRGKDNLFTGIIEEIGEISAVKPLSNGIEMTISAQQVLTDLKTNDSIAIDGVCQTVTKVQGKSFTCQAVGETIEKSTLGKFKPGQPINLERPLTANSRLGGHLVQGHVSDTAIIKRLSKRGENYFLKLSMPPDLIRYCVREGSIAVDGISLTIAIIEDRNIGISIIPHTFKYTTLSKKNVGDAMNIEIDIIARYIERFTSNSNMELTSEKLKNWGYEF
jgi:riboflavin synthase